MSSSVSPDVDGRSWAVDLLQERLDLALSSVDPRVQRLTASGTSLAVMVTERPEASVTVLLDRTPPTVVRGIEPAEIAIELSLDAAVRFARGQLSLPTELMSGRIAYRGPVRKYLAVDPVLRSLLASLDAGQLRG